MTIPAHRLTSLDAYRFGSPRVRLHSVFRSVFEILRGHDYYASNGSIDFSIFGRVALSVTTLSGAVIIYQTSRHFLGGRSLQRAWMSDAGAPNQVRRIGRFTGTDGFFFELSGTNLRAVRRLNSVDTAVDRIAWTNDHADGTGSLAAYSATVEHAYEIAIGPKHVEFFIDGVLCHVMNIAGNAGGTIVRETRLPLTYEIRNTGASSVGSLFVTESMLVDDHPEPTGDLFSYSVQATADLTGRCLVFRPLLTEPFGGRNSRVIVPRRLLVYPHGWPMHVAVFRSFSLAAFSAAVFTGVGISAVEQAQTTTDLPTLGGLSPLFETMLQASSEFIDLDLRDWVEPLMVRDYDNGSLATGYKPEQLIIHLHTHSGSANPAHVSVSWTEE